MRWLALGLAIAALALIVASFYESASYSTRAGSDAPLYSARRHDPYGTAALLELLPRRGIAVRTLERPSLLPGEHGILIQVLPASLPTAAKDESRGKQLSDWISQGNTLVQLTRFPSDLMSHLKIEAATQPVSDARTLESFEKSGEAPGDAPAVITRALPEAPKGAPSLVLWSPMRFAAVQPAGWMPLASVPNLKPGVVAGKFRIGQGWFVIVGAPTPVLNETLGEEGNLDFVLNLLKDQGGGPVIFDEWSHGIGHEATIMSFLESVGLLPVLFQLLFLAILYVWSTSGIRAPDNLGLARRPSSIEQIETLGFLYSRSLTPDLTFQRVQSEVQRRISQSLRCGPGEIQPMAARQSPAVRQRIQQLFERLALTRQSTAVRCLKCGYDLYRNQTGRCPECGTWITAEQRVQLSEAGPEPPSASVKKVLRAEAVYAEALTVSNQIAQEVQRDRRAAR